MDPMASQQSFVPSRPGSPGSDAAPAPERPLEIFIATGAAFIVALVNLVLGMVVLVVAAAIGRMVRAGVDASWIGAMVGFAAAGLIGITVAVMLTRGGYRIVQRRAGWRGRAVALLVLGLIVAVFNDLIILGSELTGAQNLLVAVMTFVVALVGVVALSTSACRRWFQTES